MLAPQTPRVPAINDRLIHKEHKSVFALTRGSILFFGNSEEDIRKCLEVKRKRTGSLKENSGFNELRPENPGLAFGYFPEAGMAKLAELAGVTFALEATEDADSRSVIAGIVPWVLAAAAPIDST